MKSHSRKFVLIEKSKQKQLFERLFPAFLRHSRQFCAESSVGALIARQCVHSVLPSPPLSLLSPLKSPFSIPFFSSFSSSLPSLSFSLSLPSLFSFSFLLYSPLPSSFSLLLPFPLFLLLSPFSLSLPSLFSPFPPPSPLLSPFSYPLPSLPRFLSSLCLLHEWWGGKDKGRESMCMYERKKKRVRER